MFLRNIDTVECLLTYSISLSLDLQSGTLAAGGPFPHGLESLDFQTATENVFVLPLLVHAIMY